MKFIYLILSVGFFFILDSKVSALDVAYDGYFRSRYNYFYNLDMNRDTEPNGRAFTDLRFRLNPTFFISDKARIRSSLNFFDGVLGDNPFRVSPYNNPALTRDRLLDPGEAGVGSTIGRSVETTTSYGGTQVPDGMTRSAALTPIQLRRLWGELETPYGTLKVGRMPHHFGYGIYANAGDDVTQEVGDSRDRIVFDTSFGSYYVRPGFGWMIEGALDQSDDDFNEYFFVFGRKTDNQDVGFYLGYSTQKSALDSAANGNFVGQATGFWTFDFFARRDFGVVDLGAEFVLLTGEIAGKNITAINSVSRAEFSRGEVKVLTEVGFSSGTSDTSLQANDLKTLAFSRDYDVSLIVFEEAIPGGASLAKSDGTGADNIPTAPHSGAVSNTLYPRLRLDYHASPSWKLVFTLISPIAVEPPTPAGGRFYGVEYDLFAHWLVSPHWSLDMTFAQFIPGAFYKDISASKSVLLGRMGVSAKF